MRDVDAIPKLDGAEVGRIFREECGRSVAALIRVFGDIDVAEDAVQEAFAVALRKWPGDGLPPNPGGWITTTARNRAIDHLRRESRKRELLGEVAVLSPGNDDPGMPEEVGPVQDDRLRLIFTCCHPALSTDAQVALTLRLLGGLSTKEVARSFLVAEPTMAQRLARAKRKIKAARIPYRVPFVALRAWIDNVRWKKVPFFQRTGKRLPTGRRRSRSSCVSQSAGCSRARASSACRTPLGAPHPARRGHLAGLQGQGARSRDGARRRADGLLLRELLQDPADRSLRAPPARRDGGRSNALPARGRSSGHGRSWLPCSTLPGPCIPTPRGPGAQAPQTS